MNNIRKLRKKRKMSLPELSMITGFTVPYLSELERGIKDNPTKGAMDKIAKALQYTVYTVFYKNTEQK